MLKKELILRNPLRLIDPESGAAISTGGFGAVTARAGVGKTAFMVQVALNSQLEGNSVLHISLDDPVKKVDLWYREVFRLLAEQYNVAQISQLWDTILPHRFIMTFRAEGFSVPILKERLGDLTDQDIFSPRMIIIDGLPFDDSTQGGLIELKQLAQELNVQIWFTVRTHRHEDPGPDGIPAPLSPVIDLFDAAIQLLPEGKETKVIALKGGKPGASRPELYLDPATMLIKEKQS